MNLKKMKLATKTSLALAAILTICLIILITVSVLSVSKEMTETVNSEFLGFATQNGNTVQGIIDDATFVAQNFQDYLEDAYETYDQMLAVQAVDETGKKVPFPTKRSAVYNEDIIELNYEVENYILHNAWSTVKNNPDIIGVGVFFEPYAYDDAIKDYTIYVNDEDADNKTVQSYGTYEEYSKNEYYSVAATTQKSYFTKPFVDNGITMITAAFPIVSGGKTQGVVMVDINVDNFAKVKSSDEKYPTMFTDILTQDGIIVYDSDSSEYVGQSLEVILGSETFGKFSKKAEAGSVFQLDAEFEGGSLTEYYYPIKAGEEIWWSSTALEKSDLNKTVVSLSILMIGIALFILGLIIVAVIFLLRRMLKPINGVVTAAESILRGELDINVTARSEDEIGILSRVFAAMSDNLQVIISEVGYLLGEMAKGNFRLATQHEDKYVGEYRNILLAMRGINRNLSSTLTEIDTASNQVSVGSEQVSGSAQSLSQGAAEQASSVEELSATLIEISQRIGENAENATLASRLSDEAGAGIKESNVHMDELMSAMHEISGASSEIGKIIKTINDIAFQTNILSLNAAVEAARAGSAGKGFAVVADEVRNLASKCAEAAKNTTVLIEGAIRAVESGTKHTEETAESLRSVVTRTETVDATIRQIAQASEEQSLAITQLTAGVEQISAVVQTNSATAEESAAASEELSGQAQMLKDLVGQFQLREDEFSSEVIHYGKEDESEETEFYPSSETGFGKY